MTLIISSNKNLDQIELERFVTWICPPCPWVGEVAWLRGGRKRWHWRRWIFCCGNGTGVRGSLRDPRRPKKLKNIRHSFPWICYLNSFSSLRVHNSHNHSNEIIWFTYMIMKYRLMNPMIMIRLLESQPWLPRRDSCWMECPCWRGFELVQRLGKAPKKIGSVWKWVTSITVTTIHLLPSTLF